jgi:hypothetical protein
MAVTPSAHWHQQWRKDTCIIDNTHILTGTDALTKATLPPNADTKICSTHTVAQIELHQTHCARM